MNICLIGHGLANLILAKILADKNINVSLFLDSRKLNNLPSRTIGISKNNFYFINNHVININKICWPIRYIQIFNEYSQKKDLLNFSSLKRELFLIVKYNKLQNLLFKKIRKNKFIKIKKKTNKNFYNTILKNNKFDLIINTVPDNKISKKFFFKKISKDYKSHAYTTIIKHQKCNNNSAVQIFTKFGPLAFLPISNKETSVVFSVYDDRIKKKDDEVKKLIIKYNKNYKINFFSKFEKFNLKFSSLRKYYYKNILSFGDILHKVHPLAGQGLNMIIRDIKILSDLVNERMDLGLPLDSSILQKFELKTKHLNFIFSSGINFIHNFFIFDNKLEKNFSRKIFNYLKKNKLFSKYAIKFADEGFS